jgi:RES domain-containing protein
MADEKTNQPSRADQYRKRSEEFTGGSNVLELTLPRALWAIAAELAEANERDREAEIRAKAAEGFVAGIQAELSRQGVIIPGGVAQVKPPRAR